MADLTLLQHAEAPLLDGGTLNKPSTIITLPNGDMCIADSAANRLVVVSQDTHAVVCELTGGADTGGSLKQPRGLACDDAALYISEASGSRVRKMRLPEELRQQGAATPRGSQMGGLRLGTDSVIEGGLTFPQGLALCGGELFVCDCEEHRIAVYDALTLTFVRSFGSPGDADGELSHPYSITLVDIGLVVCDVGNDRLSVFTTSGDFVRTIDGGGELSNPRAVASMQLPPTLPPKLSAASPALPPPRVPAGALNPAEAASALIVCEQKRLVVLSLGGAVLQVVEINGAKDMWSVCAIDGARVCALDKGTNTLHLFEPPESTAYQIAREWLVAETAAAASLPASPVKARTDDGAALPIPLSLQPLTLSPPPSAMLETPPPAAEAPVEVARGDGSKSGSRGFHLPFGRGGTPKSAGSSKQSSKPTVVQVMSAAGGIEDDFYDLSEPFVDPEAGIPGASAGASAQQMATPPPTADGASGGKVASKSRGFFSSKKRSA